MTHGTHAGYRAHRRRGEPACEPCNEANNRYHRRLRKEKSLGYSRRTVPIETVRALIDVLIDEGHSGTTLEIASGIPGMTLNSIMYSTTRKRTNTRYYQALLNVDPPTLEDLPAARRVDATGTRRRLQGLTWQGWPISELSRRSGVDDSALSKLRSGVSVNAEAQTALAIKALADELEYVSPPPSVHSRSVTRAKNLARRNGWPPLAAWDNIDDPDEKAKGVA